MVNSLINTAGVYTTETDVSQYVVQNNATIAGIVGLAPKGETNTDLLITSLQDGINQLGTPQERYPALLFMREFFNAGGGILHFVRVAHDDVAASVEVDQIDGTHTSVFNAKTTGSWFNNITLQISYGSQLNQLKTQSQTFATNALNSPYTVQMDNFPLVPGTVQVKFVNNLAAKDDGAGNLVFQTGYNPSLRTTVVTVGGTKTTGDILDITITDTNVAGSPLTLSYTVLSGDTTDTIAAALAALVNNSVPCQNANINATYTSGTTFNILSRSSNATTYSSNVHTGTETITFGSASVTAEWTGVVDYETGLVTITTHSLYPALTTTLNVTSSYWSTFTVQVLEKVFNNAQQRVNTVILETWGGLTLANAVAGIGRSKFISLATDPESFPVAGAHVLTGGDDGADNILDSDYVGNLLNDGHPTGLQIFNAMDSLRINVACVPGVSSQAVREAVQQLCENDRQDTMGILDPPIGLDLTEVADWANATGTYSSWNVLDSNYLCVAYPEYTSFNNITNDNEITPSSCAVIQALVRSKPWEAPAGFVRGKVSNLVGIARKLNPAAREFLDSNRINAIANLNGLGEMLLGQRTATLVASSLDRIGARRMMLVIENAIAKSLYPLVFEPNTDVTWNRATLLAQPYLDGLVGKEQIYFGKFQCDDVTNTLQTINNNQMVAICQIQPLKYAEKITVAFLIESDGYQITEQMASILVGA